VPGYDPDWQGRFVYATLHRAELVEVPERLTAVADGLNRSPLPVLLAAHPRTAAALDRAAVRLAPTVRRIEPVGYLESLSLVQRAAVIVTDSGGLQREAYWLGRPCLTVRGETEWVETVECGANGLVRPEDAERLPDEIAAATQRLIRWDRGAYGDGRAAERVAAALGVA
jgi:UDP-GlcNAc3NAcA epimerase